MIHTSLSPNTEKDDIFLALKGLFSPLSWNSGEDTSLLEERFRKEIGAKCAISFQRGRDALLILLKALGVQSGDEVILQAYTCLVVPNAIRFAGAVPMYVDIEEQGFNLDPRSLEKLTTQKTKAVIIQHSFGIPANITEIKKICEEKNLFLIEDCAHGLSGTFQGKPLGSFGKASFFSFGRDKIISSVWGGMITTDDAELAKKIRTMRDELPFPSGGQIAQALLHPIIFSFVKPLYARKVGRALLMLLQFINVLPLVIFPQEKMARKPDFMPQKMPSVLAGLALHQLQKLERFHEHRKKLSKEYFEALQSVKTLGLPHIPLQSDPSWLRFPIRCVRAKEIVEKAKSSGIFLGDWYRSVLAPEVDEGLFGYKKGSCPNAEKAALESFNLPTHIQMNQAMVEEIVEFLRQEHSGES